MVDKSWQMAGGPGAPLYELYDWLRRRLNGRIVDWLLGHGMNGRGVVIEAGSGTGFASKLFDQKPQVSLSVAVDYDIEALREGRAENPNLCAVVADINQLPFKDQCAALVWNSSTIEHLPDQRRVVQEMARITQQGGGVYVGVPYQFGPLFFQRWIPQTTLGIWLGTVYTQHDIETWLRAADCEPVAHWRYFFWFFIGMMGRRT